VGNEKAYVMDCLETTWISSSGPYVSRFEGLFAEFCGTRHAIACSSGTTALHLALLALGVGPDDEVIVPTLTFVATANAVRYCGARPVPVDSDPDTWCLDPAQLDARVSDRTKGIVVVHLFGHPTDMDPVREVARRRGLFVLEDAAQAHGARYRGRRTGSLGDVATFSFFGNKIVTTGEGGMVVTDDDTIARQVRLLRDHGMDPTRRYWHPVIGYNYRLTNIAAAIGLAQLERIDWHLDRRREVTGWYREALRGEERLRWQAEREWAEHAWWMFTVRLPAERTVQREHLMARLLDRGIETRPVVYPIHQLPPYADGCRDLSFPIADGVAASGLNLPTWGGLTREQVQHVAENLVSCLRETRRA
jgi:perosamine synthetase